LVGYWKLDDNNALTSVIDYSGKGNTGTAYSGTATSTSVLSTSTAMVGRAMTFDGVDDYIRMTDSASLNIGTTDFTISMWLKLNSLTAQQAVISKQLLNTNNGDDGWIFFMYSDGGGNGICAWYDQARGAYANLGFTALPNTWYHTVIVKNYSKVLIYVYKNGVLVNTFSSPATNINVAQPLKIGINNWAAHGFNGLIDEVKIFNRALSATEIQQDYVRGASHLPY
jgi:hypothetical protein